MTARYLEGLISPANEVENVGFIDRSVRGLLALFLISQLFVASTITMGVAAIGGVGILLALSAVCGWDPLYRVFGWSTHETRFVRQYREEEPATPAAANEAEFSAPGDDRKAA